MGILTNNLIYTIKRAQSEDKVFGVACALLEVMGEPKLATALKDRYEQLKLSKDEE